MSDVGHPDRSRRIRLLVEGTTPGSGDGVLGALARSVSRAFGMEFAMVVALRPPDDYEILVLTDGESTQGSALYPLAGSVFERAAGEPLFTVEVGASSVFPNDPTVARTGAQSLVVASLLDRESKRLGFLCLCDSGALPEEARDTALIQIFSARAAAELERMRVAAALQQSEALQRGILESANEAMLLVTPEGVLHSANGVAREMFCGNGEELSQSPISSLLPALRIEGAASESNENGGEELAMEGRRPDGTRFPASVTVRKVSMAGRSLLALSVRDVTERKLEEQRLREYAAGLEQANAELEQARNDAEAAARAKTQFVANVSHEVRTPMTAILGFTEMLLLGESDSLSKEQREALRTIRRNADYLLEIINDVLDFSKIEANRLAIEKIRMSLPRLLIELDDLLEVPAHEKGIELIIELDGPVPREIECDPVRLRQILLNLVGNAIKFTERGRVRVVTRYHADRELLDIQVADTGIGLSPDELERVFSAFSQADNSTTRRFGGTGLGLAITRSLAELLGGQLDARSKPGHGSTFRVRLPVVPLPGVSLTQELDEAGTESDMSLQNRVDTSRLDGRILVVEDGVDNQRVIRNVLERAGLRVEVAENGLIGYEAAMVAKQDGHCFDAILMDMQMPVLDGYQATTRLREAGYTAPIIALTAHALPEERQRCIQAGCDDYATKPIERFKLLTMLAHHMESSKPEQG